MDITNVINNSICSAVDTIVNQKFETAAFDKTIQATIIECKDDSIGEYRARYQDSILIVYSENPEITYAQNTSVYIHIPKNDFRNRKTILGTVKNLGVNYIPVVSDKDSFSINGANCVGTNYKIKLSSYKEETLSVLDNLNIDQEELRLSLYESDAIMITMKVQTEIPAQQRYQGKYGITFNLVFKDSSGKEVSRPVTLDNTQMVGNPYKFISPTEQTKAFSIDGINFERIESIKAYTSGFPVIEGATAKDNIFIYDISVTGATKLTDEELNGYKLTFLPIKGTYFTDKENADEVLPIQAQVRIKGKVAASDSTRLQYYWYKENAHIDANNRRYSAFAGEGWECLNEYFDTENGVEYVPSTFEFNVRKSHFPAQETKIKCCALYDDETVISNVITIYNITSTVEISMSSSNGTLFYFDSGGSTLTCKAIDLDKNGNRVEIEDAIYYWGKTDNNGVFSSIDNNKKTLEVEAKTIIDFATYVCTVYVAGDEEDIYYGSAQITITNSLEAPPESMVLIEGGTKVFKYNESGVSPTASSQENSMVLQPLTFQIYDEERKEITAECKSVSWKIPKVNTMIQLPTAVTDECTVTGDYYIYTGKTLHYEIRDRYNIDYANNDIILAIECRDLKLVTQTHFTFTKDGEVGTNGTNFYCKIDMNVQSNTTVPDYPAIINGSFNYKPAASNTWFKARLWEGNTEISSGNFTTKWSVLKNKYTSTVSDSSHLNCIDAATGQFTINSSLPDDSGAPADIVQVEVTYDKKTYYATLPIVYITRTSEASDFTWKYRTGFNSVMYQTDGTRPSHNDAYPFEVTAIEGATYDWKVKGSIYDTSDEKSKNWAWNDKVNLLTDRKDSILASNQRDYRPASVYDGYCVSTAVYCEVTKDGSTIATINIPVHLYLNRFGQEALNGWDGNSIQLANEGGYILSPQVGAGIKNDNNRFTGVLIGKAQEHTGGEELVGLLGYNEGIRSIFLDSKTGRAEFGRNDAGQIILDPQDRTAKIFSNNYDTSAKEGMLIDFTNSHIKYGSGNFEVNEEGHITAKGGGTIAGWNISDTSLTKGKVGISSDNSADTNIAFWAGSATATSGKFKVDFAGNLTAKNADIKGKIDADEGTIGNWYILNNRLQTSDNKVYLGTDGFKLRDNFEVTSSGNLTAKNATLKNVNAEDGLIGSFKLNSDYIQSADGKVGMGLTSDWAFWAGHTSSGTKFRVNQDGIIYATDVRLSGGSMDWGNNFKVNSSGKLTATGADVKGDVSAQNFKFSYGNDYYFHMGQTTNHPIASGLNISVIGGINFRANASTSSAGTGVASINSSNAGGITYGSGSGTHVFTGGNVYTDYYIWAGQKIDGITMYFGSNYCGRIYTGNTGGDNGSNKDVALMSSGGNASLEVVNYPNAYIRLSDNGNPTIRGQDVYLRTNTLHVHDGNNYNNTGYNGIITYGTATLTFLRGILVGYSSYSV